jgi:acetyl/propionyl-CoA carboxylase alpha subunit
VASVEFLYQPASGLLVFLEVNTRLQVEHAVTEITTGLDLVKLQLHLAAGGRLAGDPPPARGHAIEVRLNAEDPERNFLPAPGTVEYLVWASGPGVRIETGLAQGDTIPAEYDSMIAKIIGHGRDRSEARARVLRALRETTVVIRGGMTNKAFLAGLLEHPDVVSGRFDTAWLDRLMTSGGHQPAERNAIAIVAAAIEAYDRYRESARERFFGSAVRGRPQTDLQPGHRLDLRLGAASYTVEVYQTGPGRYRLLVDGCQLDIGTEQGGPFERRLSVAERHYRTVLIRHGSETLVEVDGLPHRVSADHGGLVRAPSSGVLVDIAVGVGAEVAVGDRLATLESMKMEVSLLAPAAGRVREIMAKVGAPVDSGSSLFRMQVDPVGQAPAGTSGRADFAPLLEPAPASAGPWPNSRARFSGMTSAPSSLAPPSPATAGTGLSWPLTTSPPCDSSWRCSMRSPMSSCSAATGASARMRRQRRRCTVRQSSSMPSCRPGIPAGPGCRPTSPVDYWPRWPGTD